MRTTVLAQETLGLIRFVRQAPEGAVLEATHLRTLFRNALGRLHGNAQALSMAAEDIEQIAYALVATIDETVIARGGQLAYEWMREQLQLSIFGENLAGERFFARLDTLRRDRTRADVLMIYYVVLSLGFRGQYAMRGELAHQELIESVRTDLERYGVLVEVDLAPSGERPRDAITQRSDGLVVLAIGAAAASLALLFYGGLWLDLGLRVTSLGAG